MVVGGFHHLIPQFAGAQLAVDPQAVLALVGAVVLEVRVGFGAVRELDFGVVFNRLHEGVGDADGEVEIGQVAVILGVDEDFNIRVVTAQHAHLGTPARPGGFDGFA